MLRGVYPCVVLVCMCLGDVSLGVGSLGCCGRVLLCMIQHMCYLLCVAYVFWSALAFEGSRVLKALVTLPNSTHSVLLHDVCCVLGGYVFSPFSYVLCVASEWC